MVESGPCGPRRTVLLHVPLVGAKRERQLSSVRPPHHQGRAGTATTDGCRQYGYIAERCAFLGPGGAKATAASHSADPLISPGADMLDDGPLLDANGHRPQFLVTHHHARHHYKQSRPQRYTYQTWFESHRGGEPLDRRAVHRRDCALLVAGVQLQTIE